MLRHAKSDQYSEAGSDHERRLNPRGVQSAPRMAGALADRGWVPDRVISSDATRTRETWEGMADRIGGSPEVEFKRSFYLAGPREVATTLRTLPVDVGTVMVIGHNPGWEDVVGRLSGVRVSMTTCNAVLLELDAPDWDIAMERSDWRVAAVLRPKELP